MNISSTLPTKIIGAEEVLSKIILREPAGFERIDEYIECVLQINSDRSLTQNLTIVVQDAKKDLIIPSQVINQKFFLEDNLLVLSILFPISMVAYEEKTLEMKISSENRKVSTDLEIEGDDTEIKISNQFYRADLTKSDQTEAKSYSSGQLRELFVKMGYNQLLFRTQNRIHWAPNFSRKGMEGYDTIARWNNPKTNNIYRGPYLVMTERQDRAPQHPEILLSACYKFYAKKPYFRFYSDMEMKKDIWLNLLRNDEMTMDSLFTHVAFQKQNNDIVDLPFNKQDGYLKDRPIANEDPWLCFYNQDKGYAFGSIRIKYSADNHFGNPSPTFMPHTKISNGAYGGKYWNRRLIDEHDTFVPKGSKYIEENAYLVFKIFKDDKFKTIMYWAERLRNPVLILRIVII